MSVWTRQPVVLCNRVGQGVLGILKRYNLLCQLHGGSGVGIAIAGIAVVIAVVIVCWRRRVRVRGRVDIEIRKLLPMQQRLRQNRLMGCLMGCCLTRFLDRIRR